MWAPRREAGCLHFVDVNKMRNDRGYLRNDRGYLRNDRGYLRNDRVFYVIEHETVAGVKHSYHPLYLCSMEQEISKCCDKNLKSVLDRRDRQAFPIWEEDLIH